MESNTEQYIENIAGSPYINEIDLNPLKKIRSGVKNFVNKYINPQGNPQSSTTNPTDKDFIKIVQTVVNEINKKINNDPLIKKPATPAPTSIPSTIQPPAADVDDGSHHISSMDESDEGVEDEPTSGKSSTKLHVADTEKKAGGWLSLFRGQYRKSRKFGIDIKISKVVRLSSNKFKKLENIRWVNNSHENKILVRYQDVTELVNKKLSGMKMASGDRNRSGINEVEGSQEVSGPKEIVLFKFYDDQINPKSASYNSKNPPTIGVLLEQANPYSKLVDRTKNSPELTAISPSFMESLYHVEQQKMIEFKGHQEVASNIKFHIDDDKNVLYLGAFSGKTESMPLNVVNSILEKGEAANNNDENLKDTGLDFLDFVDTLKAAGLKTDDLLTPLAKQHFGGTSQSTNINPDNGLPNTKGVQDAYLALTALGNKKSDVERWLTDIIKIDGDGLDSEAYTKKALRKPSTSTPAPQNTTSSPATPIAAPSPVQASAPSVSKSKSTGMTDAQKYSIEGNYVIGPDPKYINNSKKGVKSWKIANSKDANGNIQWNTVPSEVQDIINHNSELRSDLNKSIEGLKNNSIQIDESFNESYKLKNILTK